jgi:predicted ATPase
MLTRLKVHGFKNLANVDVSFGPFTCIAGVNGVGKSNLFDAITFLSALADRPLMEAAKSVRDERNRAADVRSLFLKRGDGHVDEMSFEAEMLVPATGSDDLGQTATAATTFLKYSLVLRYLHDESSPAAERLEVIKEELDYITKGESKNHLRFPNAVEWRNSVVTGVTRRGAPFLSTVGEGADRKVKMHQDGRSGIPRELPAGNLPRTVLSSANAGESPTALLARREMQSWRLLQLEPSSLRESDPFGAPAHVGVDGSHLASTLHRLARKEAGNGHRKGGGSSVTANEAKDLSTGNGHEKGGESSVYARVANRLSLLVENVREVKIDEDRQRELFTLQVVDREHKLHAARALSDGTLRFMALAVLEQDPDAQGLVCFEEPENGIHPERISPMLRLLKDLCVDTNQPVGDDNPLPQVIVNTHSPSVVGLVDDEDLIVAEPREVIVDDTPCRAVGFSWLSKTWRERAFPDVRTVSKGALRAYLNPFAFSEPAPRSRVKDRTDLNMLLPFMDDA